MGHECEFLTDIFLKKGKDVQVNFELKESSMAGTANERQIYLKLFNCYL